MGSGSFFSAQDLEDSPSAQVHGFGQLRVGVARGVEFHHDVSSPSRCDLYLGFKLVQTLAQFGNLLESVNELECRDVSCTVRGRRAACAPAITGAHSPATSAETFSTSASSTHQAAPSATERTNTTGLS